MFPQWIFNTVGAWIESVGIDALFWYNRTKIHSYNNFGHCYTQYPVFRLLSNIVLFPVKLLFAQEPPDSTVTIYHTNVKTGNKLAEIGNIQHQGRPRPAFKRTDDELLSEVESYLIASKTVASLDEGRDVIVIARQNRWHLVLSPESPVPTMPLKRSNVEFFVIQYMNQGTVQLHVPAQMLYAGNELFKPAFVLWLLEQAAEDYVFDEHYVLTILDQNIEEIHLTSEQYLVLGEDDYTVKRINAYA